MIKNIALSLLLGFSALSAAAQVQTGIYPYGSFDTRGFDSIDRGSLNVHFSIPVVDKQGRGVPFQYQLVYDSRVWSPVSSAGTQTWTPATDWGLHGQFNEGSQGYLSYTTTTLKCEEEDGDWIYKTYLSGYVYHDAFGVGHPFEYVVDNCALTTTGRGLPSTDGSGYSYNGVAVTSADGKLINAPVNNEASSGSVTDSNGNTVNNNGNGTFTDTLGLTALTITGSGTASSPKIFTYSTPTGTAAVTVTYKTYTVQTNFGCTIGEYSGSQDLVNTITLADGSVYQFNYEVTPGYASDVTGRLASLTLPQGGKISYAYTGANNGIECTDGTPAGLTRTITGATRTYARSSVTSSSSHTDVTDGLGNDLGFDFVMAGAPEVFLETNRTVHQGSSSGPVLLSRQTCYNNSTDPCTTRAVVLPIAQIDTYETLNGAQQHGATLTYNSYGLQTAETDYDFGGASSRGSVLRNETWTYPTSGIPSLISSDTVTDGSTLIGLTNYFYDETGGTGHAPLVAIAGLPQHAPETGQRGNLTTVNQYFNPTSYLNAAAAYEDTGNPVSVTGPTGQSTYVYDTPTHAFAITATPPTPSSGVSLPSSGTYDPNSGMPLTSVDPNNQTVSYKSYDPLLRPTEIDHPDGGKMIASYSPNGFGFLNYMTAGQAANSEFSEDAYGRLYWKAVQYGSGGYYWNNYCYDGNANLQYAAYRFAAPNQSNLSCSGAGDSYTYDALGRVLTITHADGTAKIFSYNGRATEMTDENGSSRIVQVDGLGRTTFLCEVSGSTLAGVAPAACNLDITGTGFITSYVYNTDYSRANAQELTVTQGSQVRYFENDFLGRTTLVAEPETQATTYNYAYSTTAGLGLTVTRTRPQANQTGNATTTTTTQYDSLGRVVSVNYSDGTPNREFVYDTNIYWSQVGTNLKGRLAVTGGGTASTWNGSSFSYDAMGRVINIWQCGPATCGTGYQAARPLSFAYDWAGNLIQESDNVSGTINYGRSVAGEVTSITNATYENLPQNPPDLVSNVVNGPDGPVSYSLGNGLNVYLGYDSLGRLTGRWVCNGPAAMYCSGGAQVYGTGGPWRGSRMLYQSDTVLNQQVTFGYDEFNRLNARTVTQGTQQNYTYGYDRYGNRVSQTPLQGGYTSNLIVNPANNRITTSGYAYDAAGNMINDAVHSYTYDAEGNIVAVDGGSTAQYVYDVFNRRIHVQTASGTTEYIYDYAGRRISSWVSPNNNGNEGRIYWDGQLVAHRSLEALTYFDHQDTLGTQRIRTNYGGSVASTYLSLPWGDDYSATVNNFGGDQDNEHFAGLERDAESDTEHAQFRSYASAQGRWLAPDPYVGSYDLANPQSMNRYAYALNNPTSLLDPLGLYGGEPCPQDDGGGGGSGGCGDGGYGGGGGGGGGVGGNGGGRGGGGTGGDPVNKGNPFTFSVTASTRRQRFTFAQQYLLLESIPFAVSESAIGALGAAPNNGTTVSHCLGVAAADKGVSIGLDILGSIPAVGNAVSAGAGIVRAGIAVNHVITSPAFAVGSGIYGAYGSVTAGPEEATDSLVGAGSAGAGIGLALADASLEGTKAIPIVGNFVSVATVGWDGYQAYKKYQSCMAGH